MTQEGNGTPEGSTEVCHAPRGGEFPGRGVISSPPYHDFRDERLSPLVSQEEHTMMTAAELCAWRERQGCTWKALAEAIHVAPNTVRRWARGDLAIGQPRLLALALAHLEQDGLACRAMCGRALEEALAESRAMAEFACTKRLASARKALAVLLEAGGTGDAEAARSALHEHQAALAEAREDDAGAN